jgi:photosystem II stability/assembly factor-like uncharacterized protein
MKKLSISICLMFISIPAFTQWIIVDTVAARYLGAPYEIDYNIRYATDGTFYLFYTDDSPSMSTPPTIVVQKTINDGKNWSSLIDWTDYSYSAYDLNFPTADTGFFSYNWGAQSHLVKTTNGGSTWTYLTNSGPSVLFFINPRKGYGMHGNIVYRYENDSVFPVDTIHASTWQQRLFFTKNKTGYLTYSVNYFQSIRHSVLKSTDDGNSWNVVLTDTTRNFYNLFFLSDSIGYISSDSGKIFKTLNAGDTWEILSSGNDYLSSFSFTSINEGYAVGSSGVMRTIDGGYSWQQQSIPNVRPYDIKMINDTVGYITAITYSGAYAYTLVLKTAIGPNSEGDIQLKESALNFYPNPASTNLTIEISQKSEIEISNIDGQIIKTLNLNENHRSIDISHLSKGIYIIKAKTDKTIVTKIFIKQ